MQVIDQINGSALFGQSAYSAEIATKDNLGRDITSTYLTGVDLTPYATTEEVSSVSSELSNQIDYLSGHAGKTYEGVLPISVDNTNNEISISSTPFSVQEPLYFVENSNTSVVVGFSGDTFTGARVNIPLTGDGTTENPLGLMSYISWGGNGTTSTFTRSGVRVLDENNNSAYYLASGLNLNNESITDSAISSWNDTKTTVETNSANWGGITSVDTNHGISGNGTTSTPIGIASSFQLENPSVYTTATYKGDSIGIEGLFPRIQLKTDNSSYNTLGEGGMTITHSASGVGGGYTTSHYGSTMRLSYNDGDYYLHTMDTTKSGLGVAYKASPNVKAYYNYSGVALTNDNGATNEYVNVASIRNWNDVYDTVSSNSASWTGGGSTYTAGNGIDITNDVISVTGKQDSLTGEVQNGLDQVYTNSANWNNSMSGLFLAEYGNTSYDEVKSAVDANKIVYCLMGSRRAFLAYAGSNNYEFQYYRSLTGHSDGQQGDQVFVYTITKNTGSGTWSTTQREAYTRVSAGEGLSSTYGSNKITLGIKDISSYATNTDLQYVSGQVDDVYNTVSSNSSTWDSVTAKQDELTFAKANTVGTATNFGYFPSTGISSVNGSAFIIPMRVINYVDPNQGTTYSAINRIYKARIAAEIDGDGNYIKNTYQKISGVSANEWNNVYDTVSSNSSTWDSVTAKQDELTFGYDSNDAISSINNSAISESRQGTDLYVQYPLFTGTSGTSAYIGCNNETVLFSSDNGEGWSITMAEPPSNFERVIVLQGRNRESCNYAEFPGSQNVWQMTSWIISSDGSSFICDAQSWSINGVSGSKIIDQRATLGSTYNKETGTFTKGIWKVIGINRKQV